MHHCTMQLKQHLQLCKTQSAAPPASLHELLNHMCRQHITVLLRARLVCRLVCSALWGRGICLWCSRLLVLGGMGGLAFTASLGLPLLLDSGCLSLLGDC